MTKQNEENNVIKPWGVAIVFGVIICAVLAFHIAGQSKAGQAEEALREAGIQATVFYVEKTRLEGVNLYATDKGFLLADIDRGVVIRGELEDLRTGAPIVPTRERELPFFGGKGKKPVAVEPAPATNQREPAADSESVLLMGTAVDQQKLKTALAKRLEELRRQKSREGASEQATNGAAVVSPTDSVAPTTGMGPAGSADALPPKGAIPRLGFDNAGNPVSEDAKRQQAKALMDRLPNEWMVVYPALNEKHAITVFTDPTCPYCKRLHDALPELNAAGITVRYLFYPRAMGVGSHDPRAQQLVERMNAAWCSVDTKASIDTLFSGGSPGRPCSELPEDDTRPRNPAADHYTLGQIVGVNATPYIVQDSGHMWAGFQSAESLIRRIEMNR